jgi:large repetitive protein
MAISVVQTATNYDPPTGTCSFSRATTAGNCVVVFIFTYALASQTITTTGCTLGGSADNFAQAISVQTTPVSGDTDYLAAWYDPDCAGGQTVVVANVTNATWQGEFTGTGLILMELSGVAASFPLDVTSASAPGATGTQANSGTTAGTSVAAEMALGAVIDAETFTAADGSYTNVTMGSPISCIAGYMPVPNAGTGVSYTATCNEDNVFGAIVFALKPAAAAPPPSITTTSLPSAAIGIAYSATLAATGGTTPYTWSISSGSLPAWASLNAATGVISGTPTAAATTSFTVKVTDATALTATQALSITVTQVGPGNTSLGWTSSATGDYALVMLEVLPVIAPLPPTLKSLRLQAVKRAASY